MKDRQTIGKLGENKALEFLERQGFQLVTRNYRHAHGEIDLILTKAELLVFVEVKTRTSRRFGFPEEHLSRQQMSKIQATAEAFLAAHRWTKNIRFYVMAVVLSPGASVWHFKDVY